MHMLTWGVRIFLVICLAIGGFYCLLFARRFAVLQMGLSMRNSMYFAGMVMFILVSLHWTLIWRGLVPWTQTRYRLTMFSLVLAWVIGFPIGILVTLGVKDDFGWFLSAVLPTFIFVLSTPFLWIRIRLPRRAPAEMTVRCPKCSYNLRGLTEARCPECGGQFTLEQLVLAGDRHG